MTHDAAARSGLSLACGWLLCGSALGGLALGCTVNPDGSAAGLSGGAGATPGAAAEGSTSGEPSDESDSMQDGGVDADDNGTDAAGSDGQDDGLESDGDDGAASGAPADDGGAPGEGDDGAAPPPVECPASTLDDLAAFPYAMPLAAGISASQSSCGGDGSEHRIGFTAPQEGIFRFSTLGSDFDTVLYALGGADCSAPELACDDDGGPDTTSVITVSLDEGEAIVLVADAYADDGQGNLLLDAEVFSSSCDPTSLGSTVPATASATTDGLGIASGSCGGEEAPEAVFEWTAPAAGDYRFSTEGSAFDTVLHIHDGGCMDAELGCDDDGGTSTQSVLTLSLAANQTVSVVVDGYSDSSGAFELAITEEP